MDNKRLLVVGGSGFIGSHLVRRALSFNWSVVSLSLSSFKLVPEIGKDFRHYSVNLLDKHKLAETLTGGDFDYVINCGGYIDHRSFAHGGKETFSVHFEGLLNLIDSLNTTKIKKLINIGSSDEYGQSTAPQSEDDTEKPISPYSLAKVSSAKLLQMLHLTDNFPTTTLRLFLTYGPEQDVKRFIPNTIVGCIKGKKFPCSIGTQLRDFCYIEDVVDAIFLTLENTSTEGEIINVASGMAYRIKDVIEMIRKIVGSGVPEYGKIKFREGENMELYADISKARELLNWHPKLGLSEGLKKTIEWYKENNE